MSETGVLVLCAWIVLLVATVFIYRFRLEHRTDIKKDEAKSADIRAVLEAVQTASEEQSRVFGHAVEALQESVALAHKALDAALQENRRLLDTRAT